MKLSLAVLAASISGALANQLTAIQADSKLGVDLLSKARQLDQGDNENDMTWMQDFSIKFLGCHHVAQWNSDADAEAENEVRIKVQRHVRFRLCPHHDCSASRALGCTSGFGDYIVDMDTFVASYRQNVEDIQEMQCEYQLNNRCSCEGGDDDGYDEDLCKYKCYMKAGMSQCVENNPYYDNEEQEEEFNIDDYTYCAEFDGGDKEGDSGDEGERKLDGDNQDEIDYYLGPYCTSDGSEIHIGMFTDDTCTEFADEEGGALTFASMVGAKLPYSTNSIVDQSCYTCLEQGDNDDDGNAATKEVCTDLYQTSGKCETEISDSIDYPNENACTYITGIKILKHKSNGVIYRQYHGTKAAALLIAFFATVFVMLAFYVCFLKSAIKKALDTQSVKRRRSLFNPKKREVTSPKKVKRKLSFNFLKKLKRKNNSEGLL